MKEKLQEYALIAEIISGIAIVISLVFVGIQIQQGTEETVASRGETIDVVGSPQSILMATTGRIVGEFTQNDDDTSNDVPFSVEEKRRILQILNANKDKILLESNWQLSLQSVVLSRQSVLAELNRELISKIEGAL